MAYLSRQYIRAAQEEEQLSSDQWFDSRPLSVHEQDTELKQDSTVYESVCEWANVCETKQVS